MFASLAEGKQSHTIASLSKFWGCVWWPKHITHLCLQKHILREVASSRGQWWDFWGAFPGFLDFDYNTPMQVHHICSRSGWQWWRCSWRSAQSFLGYIHYKNWPDFFSDIIKSYFYRWNLCLVFTALSAFKGGPFELFICCTWPYVRLQPRKFSKGHKSRYCSKGILWEVSWFPCCIAASCASRD